VHNFWLNVHPIYCDREAGKYVYKLSKEEPLKIDDNHFSREFMYGSGASCDGYWFYEHLAVQLEDCLDVIQCLYKDRYDFKSMSTIAVVMIDRKKCS